MKIAILESRSDNYFNPEDNGSLLSFCMLFQEKMERLIQWLISKEYVQNGQNFADFSSKTNVYLQRADYDHYFSNWLEFQKSLFEDVSGLREKQIKEKAEESKGLK